VKQVNNRMLEPSKQHTNHELKGEHAFKWYDEDHFFGQILIYRLWICRGCEHGVLQQEYSTSEMQEGEEEISYFPERSQHELFPKPYSRLKLKLAALYKEAITCYNHEALIMCAVGLRALLEGICEDKKIKERNLKGKIEGLVVSLPNRNIIRNLHHFRFMGNEAAHELAAPKPTELLVAISVIEDLLSLFYELNYKASLLRDLRRAKETKAKIVRKPSDSINDLKDEAVTAIEPAASKTNTK
jgi:hypothetical protein